MRSALFSTPRPVPSRALPALGSALVLALALPVFLVATAASDPRVALAAALTYALAYTFELGLSLLAYFGSPA